MEHKVIPSTPSELVPGNLPNILNRISCSKKALNATLAFGLSKGHRSNPAATLHVLKVYGTPVLMSGLASLVLSSSEVTMIHQHHKNTVRSLQKLHNSTPQSVIFFMGGCLPATATLHLRQLTNFAMVTRMPKNPLHSHVCHLLTTAKGGSRPWYYQIRNVYKQYGLPHPLTLLESPLSKEQFKKLPRSKIVGYWEQKLRAEFSGPPSLECH